MVCVPCLQGLTGFATTKAKNCGSGCEGQWLCTSRSCVRDTAVGTVGTGLLLQGIWSLHMTKARSVHGRKLKGGRVSHVYSLQMTWSFLWWYDTLAVMYRCATEIKFDDLRAWSLTKLWDTANVYLTAISQNFTISKTKRRWSQFSFKAYYWAAQLRQMIWLKDGTAKIMLYVK